ncbi:hypothetical protein CONPUDRAFT_48066 [Coniophora puteana RWD-64-598 SS2]|uniref:Tc1-like transposase DDE domain-containing protein n=1 Tax=Coniophora puteana (strain RWD-64-598) TaxID=741705 RepID=A0A5M3N3Q7_CONPW|nr:uncharacterized protein CONPUDRAFT_48066 [Coniophora puteana RWD-64-598 SS2]EIW85531.1 hypothetical protein CONPUDRAFT_48066 [Coniophora puteana RWD-64-598 SS2]
MGNRRISPDVKVAAIRLQQERLLDLEDILRCLDLSRSTFFRALKLWRDTGDVVGLRSIHRGRPRNLNREDHEYLLDIIKAQPERFLDELQSLLMHNRFISVHFTTIFRELVRAGVTNKKLKRIAKERSEYARGDFISRISQYDPRSIGFIDETSKDERTICRRHGCFRISAGTVVEGSMNRDMFLDFLENGVVSLSYNPSLISELISVCKAFSVYAASRPRSQCSCAR